MPMSREAERVRRGARSWLFGGAALAVAAAAGAACQAFVTAKDRRRYPAPGRLADAGGHDLHLNVAGEGQGDRPWS